ncbi:Non-specific lipid transfer protein GPI-anchored 14 [Linum perenne]
MSLMMMMIMIMVGIVACRDTAAASTAPSTSSEKEIEECAEELGGLASCLPYVGGTAKSPTRDCCGGLKELLKTNKKCLCVVIKDRDDPQLGLHIDLSLAISLPSVCNVNPSPNISKCPDLLHLAPSSPDAQLFYQLGNNNNNSTAPPTPAPAPSAPNVIGGISGRDQSRHTSNANINSNVFWLLLELLVLLLWIQ